MGRGIVVIRILVLKVNNKKNFCLTHHEVIDRIAEKIESVITQVYKGTKLWIHPNLRRIIFSLTFSFKFTYFCIVDI